MKITDVLDNSCIISDLKSQNKKDVISEIIEILKKNNKIKKPAEIIDTLMERENLGSTGIGYGIAIPHGKTTQVNSLVAVFARSINGVEFDSLDGEAVKLIFLLLTPKNDTGGSHLKALARISSLLKDKLFRQQLINADSKESIYSIILKEDKRCG